MSIYGYQNNDNSASLIPKWDLKITNFLTLDLRIEGLQLLVQCTLPSGA